MTATVVDGRKRQVVTIEFFCDHDRPIDGQAAAAVLDGCGGEEPAAVAEVACQLAEALVVLRGIAEQVRDIRDVRAEPCAHFGAERFLLGGIGWFEVHRILQGAQRGQPGV